MTLKERLKDVPDNQLLKVGCKYGTKWLAIGYRDEVFEQLKKPKFHGVINRLVIDEEQLSTGYAIYLTGTLSGDYWDYDEVHPELKKPLELDIDGINALREAVVKYSLKTYADAPTLDNRHFFHSEICSYLYFDKISSVGICRDAEKIMGIQWDDDEIEAWKKKKLNDGPDYIKNYRNKVRLIKKKA